MTRRLNSEIKHVRQLGPQTNKVKNSYFDEALELSDAEEVESQQSMTHEDDAHRGDTPPSANLTDEDEYDHGGDVSHNSDDLHDIPTSYNPSSRPAGAAAGGRTGLGGGLDDYSRADLKTGGVRSESHRQSLSKKDIFHDDDDEDEDDLFGTGAGDEVNLRQSKISGGGQSFAASGGNEMNELFQYISRYKPQELDLDAELKPFIPDYIASIGDIDAFIKIPRPDKKPDSLGLTVLDEPAAAQSDPSVLDLHLRAVSKSTAVAPQTVRSIDAKTMRTNPRVIDAWIKNIRELHGSKPPPSVHYTKRMPDVEELMQVWPEEVEAALKTATLPSPDVELPLTDYAKLLCLLLDIPAGAEPSKSSGKGGTKPPTSLVESLHVMFTLYSEFQNSAHFKALERTMKTEVH
ncbi:Intraflagellar transport protein 46 [Rhizophlyctis rosea]|uniref:Intraflagellar transport protein 46 n=1 Tax=Rhizophlyctis rosea TaxID=64517 RepID=A0AAD5SES2_9FUNG|nr:Intraflagellar transport protein 46 [Rhizophlyctis rosea]